MRLVLALWVVVTAFSMGGTQARADVLFDNLDQEVASGHPTTISYLGPIAQSFSTGSTAGALTLLKVEVMLCDCTSGSTQIDLYSSTAGAPGTLVADIGTIQDSALSIDQDTVLSFQIDDPIALAANATYWIVMTGSEDSGLIWDTAGTSTGTGTDGQFLAFWDSDAGAFDTVEANGDPYGPFLMSVTTADATVPEPASAALLGIGLVGLAFVRRPARQAMRA